MGNSELTPISPESEPHIIIGKDRIIRVPDELKHLAVQYEHNVTSVTFDCPRYSDGIDLLDLMLYVNYYRQDNTPGSYAVTDARQFWNYYNQQDGSDIDYKRTNMRNLFDITH